MWLFEIAHSQGDYYLGQAGYYLNIDLANLVCQNEWHDGYKGNRMIASIHSDDEYTSIIDFCNEYADLWVCCNCIIFSKNKTNILPTIHRICLLFAG